MAKIKVKVEQRLAQRFPHFAAVDGKVLAPETGEIHGITRDVSETGCLFLTERPLPVGSELEITTTFPKAITLTQEMRVRCLAKVVRTLATLEKPAVAVHFDKLEFIASRTSTLPLHPVPVHPHPSSGERHAFVLQTQPLLEPVLAWQQDASASAHHALPGQSAGSMERPHHLPRGSGETGLAGHLSVGGNFAAWDFADGAADAVEHARATDGTTSRSGGTAINAGHGQWKEKC
jgi:hypothetical protein